MGCNAYNHPPGCDCGFGGEFGCSASELAFWRSLYELRPHDDDLPTIQFYDVPIQQDFVKQVTFNTTCPVCGDPCYYYANEFGSKVWFDELGVPWTKHPCFLSEPRRMLDLTERETNVSVSLYDLEPTVRPVVSKLLWQTRNWYFFAVLKDKRDTCYSFNKPKFFVEDHEITIGYFLQATV